MANKYRFLLMNGNAPFLPADGVALNSVNGVLVAAGGWNSGLTPSVFSHVHESSDDGATWIPKPDAPWAGKHTFGNGVRSDNWIYYFGGDIFGSGILRREVHRYNQAAGVHELVSPDWGPVVGDRVLYSSTVHKNDLFVLGGQEDGSAETLFFNDICKSTDGGITWIKVADLPAFMENRSVGALISAGNDLFFIGGAKYGNDGNSNYGNDLCKSTDGGITWAQILTNDNRLKGIYSCGAYWDGKLWFLKGFHDGKNQPGIVYINPATYEIKTINYNLAGRHAASLCVHNDGLNVICGSTNAAVMNDSWRLVRL